MYDISSSFLIQYFLSVKDVSELFRKVKQDRIYKDIANQILEAIFRGDLRPHDKLPSEKELQEIFGVSRVTVREAIQSLDQFGVIEVRQGSQGGAYVREMDLNDILPQLENALRMTNLTITQVTQARVALEEAIIRGLAPSKITEQHIADLLGSIAAAEDALEDKETKKHALVYFGFHTMLAEMTENPIVILMNRLIHRLLLQHFEDMEASVPMSKEILEEHKRIVEFLGQGKFEEASRFSTEHIFKGGRQFAEKSKEKSLLGKHK
jgi:DNA-binding FadR family transcriptional regulator